MIRIFEAQRLINLDTIFEMADNLESVTKGEKLKRCAGDKAGCPHRGDSVAARVDERSREELDGVRLLDGTPCRQQRKMNLRAAVEKAIPSNDAERLRDLRGLLAPLLRDTLVGFNYIHYAPPGRKSCIRIHCSSGPTIS
jgi:hypothetical protein